MGPWLVYASLLNGASMALYNGSPNSSGFAKFVQVHIIETQCTSQYQNVVEKLTAVFSMCDGGPPVQPTRQAEQSARRRRTEPRGGRPCSRRFRLIRRFKLRIRFVSLLFELGSSISCSVLGAQRAYKPAARGRISVEYLAFAL
jgi:hypothetical protein